MAAGSGAEIPESLGASAEEGGGAAGTAGAAETFGGAAAGASDDLGTSSGSGNLLSPDSRIYQSLSWVVSLVTANLVAVVGFVLVLPGGLSWLLLFSLGVCLVRDGDFTWRGLWRIVRANWLVASVLWLADLLFAGLVIWESLVLTRVESPGLRIAWGALLCLGVFLVVIVNQWLWLMLAMRGIWRLAPHESRGKSGTEESRANATAPREPRKNPQDNLNPGENPRLSRRELSFYLRGALLLSLRYLPRSLVGVLLLIAPIVVLWAQPGLLWQILAWIFFFGIAFGVYLVVLAQYRPLANFFRALGCGF